MVKNLKSRALLITIVFVIAEISVALESHKLNAQRRPAPNIDYERMTRDFELMSELASMWNLSESTPQEEEIAAFLLRNPLGHYSIVRWPDTGSRRTSTWSGPVPRGTIAVVHTHPNGWSKPSWGDHQEATRTGLPFIVLTRINIWVAEPGSRHATPVVKGFNWTNDTHLASLAQEERRRENGRTIMARADDGEVQPVTDTGTVTSDPRRMRR